MSEGATAATFIAPLSPECFPLLSIPPSETIEEPAELRDAIVEYLRCALAAYENAAGLDFETVFPAFRYDDARLRSTRGRNLTGVVHAR